MQLTGIEAYEGCWEDDIIPAKGKIYRISTTSQLAEGLHQDVWFTDGSDYTLQDYLYLADVIETIPATEVEGNGRTIVIRVKDTMPVKNILESFSESSYPSELDNKFNDLLGGRGWFGAKLIISKIASDTYNLNIDYYGNTTEIIASAYQDKMYAWLTLTGFGLYKFYLGKYILPAWLKYKMDHPEEDENVNYYDLED